MNVELSKGDLVNLVNGTCPNYPIMDKYKSLGYYDDNNGWRWIRNELKKLKESELFDIYKVCLKSWK